MENASAVFCLFPDVSVAVFAFEQLPFGEAFKAEGRDVHGVGCAIEDEFGHALLTYSLTLNLPHPKINNNGGNTLYQFERLDWMNQKQSKPLNRKKVITSIAVVSAIAATGYEESRLSANPLGEKDCPPVFAQNTVATVSQINVEIAPLSAGEMIAI